MRIIKLMILLLILSSCSIIPIYKVEKTEYCERKYYDTICVGREDEYSYKGVKSIYDD